MARLFTLGSRGQLRPVTRHMGRLPGRQTTSGGITDKREARALYGDLELAIWLEEVKLQTRVSAKPF